MDADEIRKGMALLTQDQQSKLAGQGFREQSQKFESLGLPADAIIAGLQSELMERACSAHNKIEMGQWLANLGGLLLAAHAAGVDLERGGQVPNHHLSLELLKYAIGRYLGEGGDPSGLRDLLVCMIQDLSNVQPEIQ